MNIAAGARGYKMQFLVSWDTGGLSQERFENRINVVALSRILLSLTVFVLKILKFVLRNTEIG